MPTSYTETFLNHLYSTMPAALSFSYSDIEPYFPYAIALLGAVSLTYALHSTAATKKSSLEKYRKYVRKIKKIPKTASLQLNEVSKLAKELENGEFQKVKTLVQKMVLGEFDGLNVDMNGLIITPSPVSSNTTSSDISPASSAPIAPPSKPSATLCLPLTRDRLIRRIKGLEESLLKLVMKCDNIKINSLLLEFSYHFPFPTACRRAVHKKSKSKNANEEIEDSEIEILDLLLTEDRQWIETEMDAVKCKKKEVVKGILEKLHDMDEWIKMVKECKFGNQEDLL